MKSIIFLSILFSAQMLLQLHYSCTIDPPDIPVDTTKSDTIKVDSLLYDIIWQTPQNITDSSGSFSPHFTPVIIGDLVMNANDVYGREDDVDTITAYKLETGEVIWKWSDFVSSKKNVSGNAVDQNTLYVTNGFELVAIDALTGKTIFRRVSNFGPIYFSVSHQMLFHVDMNQQKLSGDLIIYNTQKKNWDKVVTVHRKEPFTMYLFPPRADIHNNGDTLLYFQNRFSHPDKNLQGSELYCYNMTKKEMVWNSMVDSLVSNVNHPPYVDDSRVYFCSAKTVHCFDKFTGERIWRTHFPNTNFLATNYLMTEDKIVIGSDNGERIGVRKSDGKVVYNIKSYATSFWRLARYKNWLLNVNKQLEVYDINSGEKKFFINTRHKKGYFNTGVAVDESTGLFYLPDGYNMMCIRVKDL